MANYKISTEQEEEKNLSPEYILYQEQERSQSIKEISTSIFGLETLKVVVRQPLVATETADKFDVIWLMYRGGGYTGQAGAIRHGIARALLAGRRRLQTGSQESRLPDS